MFTTPDLVLGIPLAHKHDSTELAGILDSRYIKKAGDTMTGALSINSTSTTALQVNQTGGGTNVLTVDSTNTRVGIGTTSPTNDLSFGGEANRIIWLERTVTAATAGKNLTITGGGAVSGGTDKTGGNVILAPGVGTGAASGYGIQFQSYVIGSPGTADQTGLVTRMFVGASTNARIIIGNSSTTAADLQDGLNFLGTLAQNIYHKRHTTASTAGQNLTVQAGGAVSGGTDLNGGTLQLNAGMATGTGRSAIVFGISPSLVTGTSDNGIVNCAIIGYSKTVVNAYAFTLGTNNNAGLPFSNSFSIDGSLAGGFCHLRQQTSNTAGNNTTLQASGATLVATDKNGGNLILVSGIATGTGSSSILFKTATSQASTNTTDNLPTTKMTLDGVGRLFVGGSTSPTAIVHLAAGTATASTAPLKFTSGTNLTSAEAGAMEFTTDDLYFTITTAAARKGIVLNNGSNLTSGTIPVATTNGRLIDSTASLLVAGSIATVVASTFEKAETGSDANILTYTTNASTDEFLIVQIATDVSAITGTSIVVTVSWKDSNNLTATSTLTLTAVGDGTINLPINAFKNTSVVVSSVFVGVSTSYLISAFITRLK